LGGAASLLLLDFSKTVFGSLRPIFLGQKEDTASMSVGLVFAKSGSLIALLMPFIPARHPARPDLATFPIRVIVLHF
jgi:hypothetical protein